MDEELHRLVPHQYLERLSVFFLRGEVLFPVPCIIKRNPGLAGYYRLVLGLSRKECEKYPAVKKLLAFEPMPEQEPEQSGHENVKLSEEETNNFCDVIIRSACALLDELDDLTADFLRDLSLLTLGAQFRGSYNNLIGREAAGKVFRLIRDIVVPRARELVSEEPGLVVIKNAAGREVRFRLGADPDILITEKLTKEYRQVLAVEVKGGTDKSNIHNRLGEAEKTHLKCKVKGARECWTVVGVKGLDLDEAKRESPTTNRFFEIEALTTDPTTQKQFVENLVALVGIPLDPNQESSSLL